MMKKNLYLFIVSLILLSTINVGVNGQLSRNDVCYVSSQFGMPVGWNPLLGNPGWMTESMYPSLYLYSPFTDDFLPYVAESYYWINDYTLEVKIKDEATWWDNSAITAYDINYTLWLRKKFDIAWQIIWKSLENIEVADEKTIRFILNESESNYYYMLNILTAIILPEHRWENLENIYGEGIFYEFLDNDPEEIVGAGPYKLMSYDYDAATFTYVRVDDWWGKEIFGLPKPKYIVHKVIVDNSIAASAFENGEIDVMTHFVPSIWKLWEEKGLERGTYYNHEPYYLNGGIMFLWMNYEEEALANLDVRRAIAHAIPFDDLISKAYCNYSVRAAPVPIIHTSPAAKYINQTLVDMYKFEFNLTEAKKILDDAGIIDRNEDGVRELPDGTNLGPFTIQVPYGWTDWMMMCDMIAENLNEIGIGVSTEFPELSVWWQRLMDKDWDLVIGWADANPGYSHPWNSFRSTMDPRLSYPLGNWENYKNESVIPLIDAIPKESDPAVLMALYSKLQEIWLRDLPGVPLFYGAVWYEYSEEYWVGWSNEENGFWFAGFFSGPSYWPSNMPVFFSIAPKGETPVQPRWVTETKIPAEILLPIPLLRVRCESPVNLLVVDSLGRKVGFEPEMLKVVNEVPGAIYNGPEAEHEEITIIKPEGNYLIQVIGVDAGTFTLTIEWNNPNIAISSRQTFIDETREGIITTFETEVSREEASTSMIVSVDVEPSLINLKSNGKWVTAYIKLPKVYNLAGIDLSKVKLEELPAITDPNYSFTTDPSQYLIDYDGDGILELMVKFDRTALIDYLNAMDFVYNTGKTVDVKLMVTGEVEGLRFKGYDTISIIKK